MSGSTPGGHSLGILSKDEELVRMLSYLGSKVDDIRALLVPLVEADVFSTLSTEDQVKHDIFVSYTLTSLFWIYLRTLGCDPFGHAVKVEVDRVQEYVARYKKVKDRKKAPHLDKDAAKRFIRSGLWDPNNPQAPSNTIKTFDDVPDD